MVLIIITVIAIVFSWFYLFVSIPLIVLILLHYDRKNRSDSVFMMVEAEYRKWEEEHPVLKLYLQAVDTFAESDGHINLS